MPVSEASFQIDAHIQVRSLIASSLLKTLKGIQFVAMIDLIPQSYTMIGFVTSLWWPPFVMISNATLHGFLPLRFLHQ